MKSAVERSACSTAVSRASVTVDNTTTAVRAANTADRDEQLARWSADDTATQQTEQHQHFTADPDVPF
ncbi:hypothetical protein HPO96_29315 [Kribbella sandramycini]|uniref:Uncharacterized protein n=1 Tax=Kribbella sandramycini TaxID=60450 RepID=A0A7Y4L4R7_9ACTN|nr:hypothetical protein [Kribbella sandramycini]MBB6571710.1 hypothetical protein [Kribbella sandramycini]NOL44355.1 hypothetical protein [Kribbella sandramycini]